MKIKYSFSNEISVEGTQEEMRNLSNDIIDMTTSDIDVHSIILESSYNPSPYDKALCKLEFAKAELNEITILDEKLIFHGTPEFFESISKNIPFDVDRYPYHSHYDSVSFPNFLSDLSPDIVFIVNKPSSSNNEEYIR